MDSLQYIKRTLAGTEVVIGRDLIGEITPYFAHTLAEGAVCIIYDRNLTELAEDIIHEFKTSGYREIGRASCRERV